MLHVITEQKMKYSHNNKDPAHEHKYKKQTSCKVIS